MARTLFFVEAFLFAALAVAFPIIASDTAAAFIVPAGLSLLLPLACATAIWSPREIGRALAAAFSARGPGGDPAECAAILGELGLFSRGAAALGLLFALTDVCARASLAAGAETWTLLGLYLSAYAILNGQLWRILAAVVARSDPGLEASRDPAADGAAFARAYGLTPRELETASLIASGRSYKETAFELGISIKTVKAHMSRVYEKTGAPSNVTLALLLKGISGNTTKVL